MHQVNVCIAEFLACFGEGQGTYRGAESRWVGSGRADTSATSRRGRLSIKDIARLARVSHPTVSRALQNSPLVNPATAAKIRKIADEPRDIRASAVARGLVTRRTRTVGLVVTTAGRSICRRGGVRH